MQKIIALDIGSYSIKAVEILNHFKSYEISNFYEEPILDVEGDRQEGVRRAMANIFNNNEIDADRIVTAMPGQYISSRILEFNFSESQKIAAAVYGEIEDITPFQLEDMTIDHQVLGTLDGKTSALVVLTKNTFLEDFLEKLEHVKIDPKIIDIDSLSFYNLCPALEMEEGQVYGIIDIGHEKTSLVVVQNGVLRMFRAINLGGRYITDFIARDMEVSFDEAERLKHEFGVAICDENDDMGGDKKAQKVAEIVTVASKSIMRELGRSLYRFKSLEKTPLKKLFICGGSAKIKNYSKYLTKQLSVETEIIDFMGSDLNIDDALEHKTTAMGQGISIGVRAVTSIKRQSQINLRKGDYAYVQDYTSVLGTATKISKLLALALILICVSYGLKFYFYNNEISKVQTQYKREIKGIKGLKIRKSSKKSFSRIHKKAKKHLESNLKSKKESYKNFINNNSDSGALVSLQEMSNKVPKDVKVDITEYKYTSKPDGSGTVSIRLEADSFETIAQFEKALHKVDVFDDIKEKSSDTKPGTKDKIAVIETNYIKK